MESPTRGSDFFSVGGSVLRLGKSKPPQRLALRWLLLLGFCVV